jgi:hypothetical protein
MASSWFAVALAAAGSLVTEIGRLHTTRGLGRPAALAAAVIAGTT